MMYAVSDRKCIWSVKTCISYSKGTFLDHFEKENKGAANYHGSPEK